MSKNFSTNIPPVDQLIVQPQNTRQTTAKTPTQTQPQPEVPSTPPQQVTAETYLNQLPQNGQQTSAEQTANSYAQTQSLPTSNTKQQTTSRAKEKFKNLFKEKQPEYRKLPSRPYAMPEVVIEKKDASGIKSDTAAILTGCTMSFICILTCLLNKKTNKQNFWQSLKNLLPKKILGAELLKKLTNWSKQRVF